MTFWRLAVLLVGVALGSLLGCGPRTVAAIEYPGRVGTASELGPDVMLRQRLVGEGRTPDGETATFQYDLVLQKRGDTLLLLALSPFNTRVFAIEQTGSAIEVTSFTEAPQPVPPRFVLIDVYRALALPAVADEGESLVSNERSRVFTRADQAGVITVRYSAPYEEHVAPEQITITNEWLGYELTIETLSRSPL